MITSGYVGNVKWINWSYPTRFAFLTFDTIVCGITLLLNILLWLCGTFYQRNE